MNVYAGTLGQLIIIEVFVFCIWISVLMDAVKNKDTSISTKRLLLTSIGLVLNAFSITGIMSIRVIQFIAGQNPYTWSIIIFYTTLAIGNFLFIVTACLGTRNPRLLQAFIVVTLLWTSYVVYSSFF